VGRRVSDRGKKKKRRGAGLFAGEGVGPVGRCGLKGEGEVSFPFFFFFFFKLFSK
jgi:hypothetical protein